MRRNSHTSPRASTSEWVPLTTTTSITPVVAISDAHQTRQIQNQFTQPGTSTTPLLSDQDDATDQSGRLNTGENVEQEAYPPRTAVAAAYPYDAGGSTTYDPSPLNRFIRSKPARNTALMVFLLVLLTSLLHATQPELVDHGYKVLSNAIYRNMGWKEKQEMMSLDARLRELLDRPALEQWEFEPLCRRGCPFYTYSRNSKIHRMTTVLRRQLTTLFLIIQPTFTMTAKTANGKRLEGKISDGTGTAWYHT
jgi:hypothetical protein